MTPRSVAVDANPLARPVHTGTEVYTREVARRLPAAAPELRFTFYAARPADVCGPDLTVLPGRRLWSQLRLPRELWRRRPDLLFVPAHVVPFLAPGPAVTVLHDLVFEHHPDAYAPRARSYLRLTTRWAARRCARLLTVSEATARDLVERYGVRRERITVVPCGGGEPPPADFDPEMARRRVAELGVEGPYVLHVGRIEPRKNQLTALHAVERLPDLLLVCAGPPADAGMADRLAASPRCRMLGRVGQEDLEALYAAARALVFPSLGEGFGIPVLEAMRRGLPVVTAAVTSLPEVGGDVAVYIEDPLDAGALAAAIERALGDAPRLGRLGRERAAEFTWDRTAAGVAGALREVLG
jgi:glycosyltransferase involved in cell wall biosynthesis